MAKCCPTNIVLFELLNDIEHYGDLARQVYDQPYRRVIHSESLPAGQKIVSIFEAHTDVILKDSLDIHCGHKICLAGGVSNLILDCVILEGNSADTDLVEQMLDRQKQFYGRYPLKVTLDGGFASKDNLSKAKERQIKDVCFAKKRGLKETDVYRSYYVYKKTRRFCAGIEVGLFWLKRSFGMTRCTWKGFRSFKPTFSGREPFWNVSTSNISSVEFRKEIPNKWKGLPALGSPFFCS